MAFELTLPPAPGTHSPSPYLKIEQLLVDMRQQVESRYNQKIAVLLLTTTRADGEGRPILHRYSVKLNFVFRHYTPDLMVLDCDVDAANGFPVKVAAFNEPVGTAYSALELQKLFQEVFKDQRTRNIILGNY